MSRPLPPQTDALCHMNDVYVTGAGHTPTSHMQLQFAGVMLDVRPLCWHSVGLFLILVPISRAADRGCADQQENGVIDVL